MDGGGNGVGARFAVLCLVLASLAGCAHVGESSAKGAVIGGYEGYQELKKRHGGLSLGEIARDPELQAAARQLTKAAVEGAGKGYDAAGVDEKADALVRAMIVAAREESNEAVGQLLAEQGPRLQVVLTQTLATSIEQAGSELRRTAATDGAEAVRAVTTTAVESLVRALRSEETGGMPGVVRTTTRGAGAGLVAGLREELARPETRRALAELSKSAAAGAKEGLIEDDSAPGGVWTTVAILLGVLFSLSIAALVFYIRRSILNGRALTVVAQQINKDAEREAPVAEMKQRIRERAERARVEPHLAAFLKDRGL